MHRILIADPLGARGLGILRAAGAEIHELAADERPRLGELVAGFDALIVRSATRVDADLLRSGRRLKVVGRAGAGVDNVDVAVATELGILVVNAPTANVIAAAEHTFALLLALVRRVPAADAAMKRGEWPRAELLGSELADKTLGIVGLGRIGRQVAARARAFAMRVVACDPLLDDAAARRLEVERLELPDLLASADVVTLHTPLDARTRGLLGGAELRRLRRGALLVNCGRGGLVDEEALLTLLEEGHLGGAALDVFAEEPTPRLDLVRHPNVVATPHLGARTYEAQERIAGETASMVVAALAGSLSIAAVNLPFRSTGRRGEPLVRLGERLGEVAGGLLGCDLRRVEVEVRGIEEELMPAIRVAVLKGALTPLLGEGVNFVNAEHLAKSRGIATGRGFATRGEPESGLVTVRLAGAGDDVEVAGRLGPSDLPWLVRLAGFPLTCEPTGRLLVLAAREGPGTLGRIATLLGEAGVNIAEIHLARGVADGPALAVLRLDQEPEPEVLATLAALPEVVRAHLLVLDQRSGTTSAG